jgi:cytochrome oxidase Cu insertion factor (SCO1/SenC/PrrC family)
MRNKDRPKKKKERNDERLFAIIAVVMCLILGSIFCALLFALNRRGQPQEVSVDNLPDSKPALIQPDHPRNLVDFSLTDRTGRVITRQDLKGKILVVDFLFTSCSTTCPIVNRQMAQIQQLTTNETDVKLVSLTVDPRDDTPDVLAEYGKGFGADTNRWLFLTGDKAVLYAVISQSFLAKDQDDPFGYMPGNFSHTERIAVVDAEGNLRGYFDGMNQNTAGAVVEEISKVRSKQL